MLPHSNFGIRMRRTKSKGYFYTPKKKRSAPATAANTLDEGAVSEVSGIFKKLLRGGK